MNIDFGPTLLDFAGIKVPENIQGKVLKLFLKTNLMLEEMQFITIIMNILNGTRFNHIMALEHQNIN